MRVLHGLSGLAVLFTSLAYVHIWHHFLTHAPDRTAGFWMWMIAAAIVGVFSFVGGYLLLRRAR
jgi:hypothetical protein